jgi:hypothetical protein
MDSSMFLFFSKKIRLQPLEIRIETVAGSVHIKEAWAGRLDDVDDLGDGDIPDREALDGDIGIGVHGSAPNSGLVILARAVDLAVSAIPLWQNGTLQASRWRRHEIDNRYPLAILKFRFADGMENDYDHGQLFQR